VCAHVEAQVLVMWGELDHPEAPRCKYYEWLFPNSRTEVFAGAHHPCWHEFPDKFNGLLVEFLREQESLGWTAGDSAEHTHAHRASVHEF
jgi:pimeloyl-ACP methyl ester carboxylesterase